MHEKEKEQAKQKERMGNKIQTCLTYRATLMFLLATATATGTLHY